MVAEFLFGDISIGKFECTVGMEGISIIIRDSLYKLAYRRCFTREK